MAWKAGILLVLLLLGWVSSDAGVGTGAAADGVEAASTTGYIHGANLRPLVEESGGQQTLNVYGPGGRIVAQVVQHEDGNQSVLYLLTDHLGSTRTVVVDGNNPVAGFDYAPFGGSESAGAMADAVRYRFTGHRANQGLPTYHALHREYGPTVYRWLSVDPGREDASFYATAATTRLA